MQLRLEPIFGQNFRMGILLIILDDQLPLDRQYFVIVEVLYFQLNTLDQMYLLLESCTRHETNDVQIDQTNHRLWAYQHVLDFHLAKRKEL